MKRMCLLPLLCCLVVFFLCSCDNRVNSPPYDTTDPIDNTNTNFGTIDWLQLFGSDREDFARAMAIAGDGSIFVTGHTLGDFPNQSNKGNIDAVDSRNDVFVSKISNDGRVLWHKLVGSTANDAPTSIAVTADGGVVIGGSTYGSLTSQPNRGYEDAFVIKLDGDGAVVWITMLASDLTDWVSGVAVDGLGNIYAVGMSFSDLDGLPNHSLHKIDPDKYPPTADFFIAKLDGGGGKLWTVLEGDVGNDYANDLALDSAGDLIIAGATFPDRSLGNTDAFLSKFSPLSQTFQWTVERTSSAADSNDVLAIDNLNNIYVGGLAAGVPFAKQYDTQGQILESYTISASSKSNGVSGIAVDGKGNVFITGTRASETQEGLAGHGSSDIYVKEFPIDGSDIPSTTYGGPNADAASGIVISPAGRIIVCGGSDGSLYDQTSHGRYDALLMQLDLQP